MKDFFPKKILSELNDYSGYQAISRKIFIRSLTIIGIPIFTIFGILDLYQSRYIVGTIALIVSLILFFLMFNSKKKATVKRSYISQEIIVRLYPVLFILYFLYLIGFEESLSKAPWVLIFPVVIFSVVNNKEALIWTFCLSIILIPLLFHSDLISSSDEIFCLKMRLFVIFGVLTCVHFITNMIIQTTIQNLIDKKKEVHDTNLKLNNEIIERKQGEETLKYRKLQFEVILNNLGSSIYIVDMESNEILFVNEHMEKAFGKDMIGKICWKTIYNNQSGPCEFCTNDKLIDAYGNRLKPYIWEIYNQKLNRWYELHDQAIPWIDGRLVRMDIAIDITDRKSAEEEKLNAQKIAGEYKKLALVGQVAGKMAHDFNNILGIIMGNAELSLMDCKDLKIKKTLELIFEQTLRGKNLTKNLIAFAKSQEPKQEFFKFRDTIDKVLNLMKEDLEGIELIREDKPGIPDLLGDIGMIEHALVNLLQNSIHAVSNVENPRIIVRSFSFDDNIYFEIEDNGCGIPKEHLENIYEPAFTLKGSCDVTGSYKAGIKGAGYGMSNVKKYIEQHKGKISVESDITSGTKFTLSLPVIKKELTNEEKTETCKELSHFEKYILLVEDETAISDVQYSLLTQDPCNHRVDIAPNGQVAIDLFDKNKYDFISLDYILQGNLNGMDIYNHIRETNKTIPILFISGNIEFLESIKKLKQKDVNIAHLSKPCQNKDYVNGINELLKHKNK